MTRVIGWRSEREAAEQAGRVAGQILLDRLGKAAVRMKGPNDPVTEADHAAQDAIYRCLRQRFPADHFLGEEDAQRVRPPGGRCWIVDPLDGTTNYIHGLPLFCVSIGLEVDGRLVVGVVFDPMRGELFSAAEGAGAAESGAALHVSAAVRLSEALVSVGLPTDLDRHSSVFPLFEETSRRCQSVRRLGSAALSLAYVAAGRIDAFWAHQLNCWDAAAGVVLVREAGGQVTNFPGAPYNPHQPSIVEIGRAHV